MSDLVATFTDISFGGQTAEIEDPAILEILTMARRIDAIRRPLSIIGPDQWPVTRAYGEASDHLWGVVAELLKRLPVGG